MSQPLPTGNPMRWVPSLYFTQGMQFFVVMYLVAFPLKNLGIPNDQIAHWTGLIGTAWAVKPLWSPFLELLRSKKLIVVGMQYVGAVALGLMAVSLQLPVWFAAVIAVLFLVAYASATHDIACDGLYMASLDNERQARYAGWQGAFFNGARFFMIGVVMKIAGALEGTMGVVNAWSLVFAGLAVLLASLASYNAYALPGTLSTEHSDLTAAGIWATTKEIVFEFFKKPGIWLAVLFIVLFRFAEGQVQTIGPLFLIEARDKLGLGLKRAMPVLILAMAVPNATFWYLASNLPTDLWHIGTAVGVEMFGYGFGFVGMILYIMQAVAPGKYQTAHYALGSGVMQLGFILSKTISGDIQLSMGYEKFFLWTIVCGVPAFLLMFFVKIPGKAAPAPAPEAVAA